MQALFIKYFPLEPLPADFAAQLKERVLAEVTLVIKPAKGDTQFLPPGLTPLRRKLSRWFFRRFCLFMLISITVLLVGMLFLG